MAGDVAEALRDRQGQETPGPEHFAAKEQHSEEF
jgi:hypothetical protein